jgi:hypothetical protein
MKNPSGNKLEKLVFGMFDQMVEGADKYVTKQGSTWLIFTEDKRWVIEFTNDKTLWFNYNVFQSELELIGKDCTEERDLIKSWFESRFLNKPKVEEAHHVDVMKFFDKKMENTIENGVKDTKYIVLNLLESVEDTIQNGVKETKENRLIRTISVISTIKNGVKHVEDGDWLDQDERIDDIIESGVKEIIPSTFESEEQKDHWKTNDEITESIKDVIENGVKETKEMKHNRNRYHGHFILKDDIPTYIPMVQVQDVIENGVKELKELPDKSGEFRGYGDYYHRQEDITKPHTEYVKEVIEDSYNHMGRVEGVIRNTDKDGI